MHFQIKNIITVLEKNKKFNIIGDINVSTWEEAVKEFLTLALQMHEKFLQMTQSCYSQLMHCGRQLLEMDKEAVMQPDNFLTNTYISHLETFFTEDPNHSHHVPRLQPLCDPCTYTMGGLWRVAATLVLLGFDPEVKVYKRAQAMKTLQELYANKTLVKERSTPEAVAVEEDIWRKALDTLGSMESPINKLIVGNLFRLLATILQVDRQTKPQPSLPWKEMRKSVETFRESIPEMAFKKSRHEFMILFSALRQILNIPQTPKVQGVKRGPGDDREENQAKKRKKNRNITDPTDAKDTAAGKDGKMKNNNKTDTSKEDKGREEEESKNASMGEEKIKNDVATGKENVIKNTATQKKKVKNNPAKKKLKKNAATGKEKNLKKKRKLVVD